MTNKYHDLILTLIGEKGPLGVNQLARELSIPVSNMQRYLHKQSYFRMNENKKWDLPEKVIGDVKSTSLLLLTDIVENSVLLLKAQLEELNQSVENIRGPLETLKRGVKVYTPTAAGAVADKSDINNVDMIYVNGEIQTLIQVTKKYVQLCPEEYQEMLINVDWYHLVVDLGFKYVKECITPELSDLYSEKKDNLSEDTIDVLKEYQKKE